MDKIKYRITKCYLIEIVDKDGKEINSDFSFLNYQETKKQAQNMLNDYIKSEKNTWQNI